MPEETNFDINSFKAVRDEAWQAMFADMALQGWQMVQLWAQGAPNFVEVHGQPQPRLAILPPHSGAARGMVIICAGGAFLFKSDYEAKPVAERFHAAGFNAAVLDYRVAPYTQLDACADALRAIRLLRLHAKKYNLLPDKIAIGGFSAGGILTGLAATRFDAGDPAADDPIERVSSRPDAAIQCYGSMSFPADMGRFGYDAAKQNEAARMDNAKNLRFDSPPFFLFQTAEDNPLGVINMGKELTERGIPFEVHLFKNGQHGGGLYDGKDGAIYEPHTAHWSMLAIEWLEEMGF